MNIEKLFQNFAADDVFYEYGGWVIFIPQVRFLREFGGLPEAGNSFYSIIIALWIFFFGVLYLSLYFSKTRERYFVAIGALGKFSFTVVLAVLAFTGELPMRAAFAGSADFVIAVIFSRGYTKHPHSAERADESFVRVSKSPSIKPLRASSEKRRSRL